MLNAYVSEMKSIKNSYINFQVRANAYNNNINGSNMKKIALICKENLVPLYAKAGFGLVGPSKVVHGKDPWMDMTLDL